MCRDSAGSGPVQTISTDSCWRWLCSLWAAVTSRRGQALQDGLSGGGWVQVAMLGDSFGDGERDGMGQATGESGCGCADFAMFEVHWVTRRTLGRCARLSKPTRRGRDTCCRVRTKCRGRTSKRGKRQRGGCFRRDTDDVRRRADRWHTGACCRALGPDVARESRACQTTRGHRAFLRYRGQRCR